MKKGLIYALLTAVLFATLEPVSKLIANDVTPYAITFWRFIISAVIFMPFAVVKIRKQKIHITGKDLLIMTGLGTLFICVSMLLLQLAVKKADSPSLIAIIFSSNSVFTILFAVLVLKEKLNRYKVSAIVLGVLAVLVCADFSSGTNLTSVAYAVFAAVTFSLYTVFSKKLANKIDSVVQTGIVFFAGSVVFLVILLLMGTDISVPFEPSTLSVLGYLGVFVTGLGYLFFFKAIENGGAIFGSMAFFIKPILTPFVTLFVNGISPDAKIFAAVVLVVAASYFSTRKVKEKSIQEAAAE